MTIDTTADGKLRSELKPGEQLLWAGRPATGLKFYWVDWFMIPMTIGGAGWLSYNGFRMIVDPCQVGSGGCNPLAGIVLIAFSATAANLWLLDARNRAQTYYAVTSERLLIVNEFVRRRVVSLSLKAAEWPRLASHRDGTGTVTFRSVIADPAWILRGAVWPGARVFEHPAFVHITDAEQVYTLVRALRRDQFGAL